MPVKCLFSGLVNLLRSSTWNYLRSVPVYLVYFSARLMSCRCVSGFCIQYLFSFCLPKMYCSGVLLKEKNIMISKNFWSGNHVPGDQSYSTTWCRYQEPVGCWQHRSGFCGEPWRWPNFITECLSAEMMIYNKRFSE